MRLFLTILACALLAAACAKVPSQQSYPYSYQHRMQSADHWERLAKKVVSNQITPFFNGQSESIKSVYIETKDRSAFGIAFQTYLATELFKKSIPITGNLNDGVALEWSVQKVIHNGNRNNPGPPGGIIGAVVAFIGDLFGGDSYYYGNVPHTELLVTTKLKSKDMIYSRETETLYINDKDTQNYWVMPESTQQVVQAFIRNGSAVCREPADLVSAHTIDGEGYLRLNELIKQGKCILTKNPYPVTIIEKKENYVVIRSNDNPQYIYVTPHESIGG